MPSPVGKRTSLPSASAMRNCSVFRTTSVNRRSNSLCSVMSNFEYPIMSINKTCPISNFRLEAGSTDMQNSLQFRRERGDDFVETRIAAQRVPDLVEFE